MLNVLTKKSEDKKKKKGFTLVELIIVIAIIAILAAIAVPKFLNVTKDANIKADIANAKTIQSAVTILIAKGEIDISTKPSTFVDTNLVAISTAESNKVKNALQTLPSPKANTGDFKIAILSDGSIYVYAGDKPILPTPAYPYDGASTPPTKTTP